jgi:anaerobic selenocysteine-containing dehydrogenase
MEDIAMSLPDSVAADAVNPDAANRDVANPASPASHEEQRTAYRTCPFCEACCGLELKVAGEKIVSIRGNANDVFSHGYICPKGAALKDLHEDPDRLRQPMIKRNGQFEPATWDEAFAEIEARLLPLRKEYGNDAVATVIGNPGAHKSGLLLYFAKLARALGTRNLYSASTLDQMPKQLSSGYLYGGFFSIPVPDIERTDLLVVLGANPMVSNGSLWTVPDFRGKAKALHARGGKLVVIDPRKTETAQVADQHHFIRPGSDVFLLLGIAHALFSEQRVKPGHLQDHINGLQQVQQAVAGFSPERVAARCGMTAETIWQLARQLSDAPRAALYGRIGTCTQEFGTLASWLVDVINILTGNLDREGGMLFPRAAAFAANTIGKPGVGRGIVTGRRKSRVSGAPEVLGELPISCLAEEIQTAGEGQVRALITLASNPVLSSPNGVRLATAFDQLDFMLSFDIYINETTRHADVILPGPSPLQDLHFDLAFQQFSYRNFTRISYPILPMAEGQQSEVQSLLRLIALLQARDLATLDDEMFAEDVRKGAGQYADAIIAASQGLTGLERQIDFGLRTGPYGDRYGMQADGLNLAKVKQENNGIDLGPLQPRMPELLRTPSGKIEMAEPVLLADLARAEAALNEPAPALTLIGRRQVRSSNSWMHNLPILAKGPFRCTALLHPQDAARLGLADGEPVQLFNQHGSVTVLLELDENMMPGVVSVPHGWGHDLPGVQMRVAGERPGVNLNVLFDENRRDPLSGNSVLSGIAVQIKPQAHAS